MVVRGRMRPGDRLVSVRGAGVTTTAAFRPRVAEPYRDAVEHPAALAPRNVVVVEADTEDPEDEDMRAYVSRLWAEDWDSDADRVYDTW